MSYGKKPSRTKYMAVLAEEAAKCGISLDDANGRSHKRLNVTARAKAWARLRADGYSLPGIGCAAGRDHTTVLSGIRRAPSLPYPVASEAPAREARVTTFRKIRAPGDHDVYRGREG